MNSYIFNFLKMFIVIVIYCEQEAASLYLFWFFFSVTVRRNAKLRYSTLQ